MAHAMPRAAQVRMTLAEKIKKPLPALTLASTLSESPGRPIGKALDLTGAHPEPGGPRRALLKVVHGVPSHVPRTHPERSHPKMRFCTQRRDKSQCGPFNTSKLRTAKPRDLKDSDQALQPENNSRNTSLRRCVLWRRAFLKARLSLDNLFITESL